MARNAQDWREAWTPEPVPADPLTDDDRSGGPGLTASGHLVQLGLSFTLVGAMGAGLAGWLDADFPVSALWALVGGVALVAGLVLRHRRRPADRAYPTYPLSTERPVVPLGLAAGAAGIAFGVCEIAGAHPLTEVAGLVLTVLAAIFAPWGTVLLERMSSRPSSPRWHGMWMVILGVLLVAVTVGAAADLLRALGLLG